MFAGLRLFCVLLGLAALGWARAADAADLLVFAAASLRNALDAADAAYSGRSGDKLTVSYAASGVLAKQIDNGAPADIFISADENWMDYVAERHLLRPDSRTDLLGNRLVMVAPKDNARPIEIKPGLKLASLIGDGRLALGDPASVPAGQYAKAALEKLHLWQEVQGKLAPAGDVRGALTLVSRGEAPLGIVYATDAAADPGVKIVADFPPDSYPPVVYPVALLAGSAKPEAARYLAWLRSPEAAPYFEREGFRRLP